jgi:amino acid adenylation domain-containing protein
MSSQALLSELLDLGVKLKITDGSQLSVQAPKGTLTEHLLGRVREHKAALIDLLVKNQSELAPSALPVIEPDREGLYQPFPSADLQTAFLMGDSEDLEFHVRPHYYIEQDVERLDPARFEKALNAALYRQRANLVLVNEDMQLQTLREFTPISVAVNDLRQLPEAEVEAALRQTRASMSRQTLPLDVWPWFECRVSLYGKDQARIHYNNNNVFSDGYGSQKLMADAMHYYHHPDQPLPELNLSFRDCVLALNKLEQSPLGQASQRYWLERLPHFPGPPALPLQAGVNPRSRSLLERRERVLPESIWSAFKARAREHGLTPNNALFAVYAELIAYWSGSRHFLLNNMVTHRFPLHPEVNEIIGNFASLYPLEVDWRQNLPFAERARQLQTRIMSDLQHVYWSGVKVLQALNQVQKTPGRAPCPFVVGSGLFMKAAEKPYVACLETPQVMLDHQFWELRDGGLWFVWDVIERFFPAGMIDAMWQGYYNLLQRFALDGDSWSAENFDLLPEDQRLQRQALNTVPAPLPQELLHAPMARQAALSPERVALITPTRTLTFGQLHMRSVQLAERLRRADIASQELVAVLLEKGWQQVVAVHAVLTAGAAYVPIDPAWPSERIAYVLDNIKARLVLSSRELCDTLRLPDTVQWMDVDQEESAASTSLAAAEITASARDLAYIIFTSGSTGRPKGVMIDHQGACNTVADINRRFGISADDVVFGISSLYFDLSVYDLFGSSAAGATLVLPDATEATEPASWIAAIVAHQVTVWNSVPALMQLLVDAARQADVILPSLRTVLLSGDWIPVSLPEQIRQVAPNAAVISLGGATEASIWSIYHPVAPEDSNRSSIPYGRPLANQSWHILDDMGNDVPLWVTGHLYIGGAGLALGYWQDADKTAAAFVPHPRTGERLYRTGDLGRYLPDGNIEFLGRSDFQVKIQGFRVELGEIEHALLAYPGIRAAVVSVGSTGAGKQLHAFVVPAEGEEFSAEALQQFLHGTLPHYMVPSQIVRLEQLPLSANGKVDRPALARLSERVQRQAHAYTAPTTAVETELVAIWEEVLGSRPVGIHDDFFELGGQSFAAVRVMTRITRQLGHRLPLSVLLEGRTVAHLARQMQRQQAWSPLVPIHLHDGPERACFLVHPAGGNVLCYRHLAGQLGRSVYGLQAAGLSGEQAPLERIEDMAALYLAAIRQVQPAGPYLVGGWSSGGVIAFAIARQLEAEGERVERVVMLDTPAPQQHDAVDAYTMLRWFLEDLNIGFDPAAIDLRTLAGEGAPPTLAQVLDGLTQRKALQGEFDTAQLELVYQVFSGIIHGCRNYRPGQIAAPISVLRAREGRVSEFAGHPAEHTSDWGWAACTLGTVSSVVIPGNHYTILSPQHGDALPLALNAQLAQR